MSYENSLEERGYVITPPLLNETAIADLLLALQIAEREQVRSSHETAYSLRNLFEAATAVRRLAAAHLLRSLVEPSLGADCFAVRALYFDKTPSANWKVPYHQDITVSIAERKETEGFSHWTHKDGVLHAYAPASVLENMLTVRLHLDACGRDNGALRVLPGTHRYERLNSAQVAEIRTRLAETVCEVDSGAALLMRPLLLHASSAAESPEHRRVIHIEYANAPLPDGLEWREVVRKEES